MRRRRDQLTLEVTERLFKVCEHLPDDAFAAVVRGVVDAAMEYDGAPPAPRDAERPLRPERDLAARERRDD
jgi:hypothetical protein